LEHTEYQESLAMELERDRRKMYQESLAKALERDSHTM
jgi:hypothetical protein